MRNLKLEIWWNNFTNNIWKTIIDFASYFGSVVTIYSVYFNSSNKFDPTDSTDWYLSIFLIFILLVWLIKTIKNLFLNLGSLELERESFFKFISIEKSKASISLINIAGDVSWLINEKDSFAQTKQTNPNLDVWVFYDKLKVVDKHVLEVIEEYKKLGIKMVEYPFAVPHLKALIIDSESDDKRFFVFKKLDSKIKIDLFKNDNIALNFAEAFVQSIRSYPTKIIIGISGLNNLGKSTLSSILKEEFGEKIAIVNDTFKHDADNSFESSVLALCFQLYDFTNVLRNSKSKVILFDRTPIDNLAFMYINRKQSRSFDFYIESICDEIMEFMNSFYFIAFLKPDQTGFQYRATTHLDSKTRKLIRKRLEMLHQDSHANVIHYRTEYEEKKRSSRLHEISSDIKLRIEKRLFEIS